MDLSPFSGVPLLLAWLLGASLSGQEVPRSFVPQEHPHAFRLLTPELDFGYYPTWAPDGNTIAFSGNEGRIFGVPASGGPLTEILSGEEGQQGSHPSWSPDGGYVAFDVTVGDATLALRIVSIHGGPAIQIVPSSIPISRGAHAAWSRDGSRIAFSSMGTIMVVELATGKLTQVLKPEGGAWARPFGWSPDDSTISADVGVPDSGESDVWLVPVGEGTPVQLTNFPGREGNPVWSPDGSQIAFMASISGNRDIWIIPTEGGTPTQVTFDPGMDMNPRWSPNGKRLAFASDRAGSIGIWVLDLEVQLRL